LGVLHVEHAYRYLAATTPVSAAYVEGVYAPQSTIRERLLFLVTNVPLGSAVTFRHVYAEARAG
jgi:hypothetical protein